MDDMKAMADRVFVAVKEYVHQEMIIDSARQEQLLKTISEQLRRVSSTDNEKAMDIVQAFAGRIDELSRRVADLEKAKQ
jgi:polyhydroxyalkanoate synthesis regulator phasin